MQGKPLLEDSPHILLLLMWYRSLQWFCCASWGLSAAGEFWGAVGGGSCAKRAEGAWAEQAQHWHREGEELQIPPWLTCCTAWIAMAGDPLLLGVG